ncbi:hypothetical protein I546_3793 [Mycobacterium kansasii 732]|nr:hypothetical protein I546_3793 [Mycobacterium kansasii 732]
MALFDRADRPVPPSDLPPVLPLLLLVLLLVLLQVPANGV